ncbi:glycosyltransferase family 2 protein [Photobacterium leiognathi]|uniref:glycosyltransferase family 2 protein n=1 Tax=Photobacterium leiognathi TaxID=553611 RepID=UPI003AF3CE80
MNDHVDIILATYNGEDYIVEQLESIFNQTYSNWKIYVTDDGSTDNTINLINKFVLDKNIENKVIILPFRDKSNKYGPAYNFSYGLSFSTSKYIMFSDQDDYWLPEKIVTQVNKIKELDITIPALSFCDASVVDNNLSVISPSFSKNEGFIWERRLNLSNILFQNIAPGCCMIINDKLRDLFLSVPNRKLIMHDWYLIILSKSFGNVNFTHEVLMKYRQHDNNQVGATKKYNILTLMNFRKKLASSFDNHQRAKEQLIDINNNYNKNIKNNTIHSIASSMEAPFIYKIKTLLKFRVTKSSIIKTIVLYYFI